MKIFGWVLLAALGLVGLVLFLRHRKREKTPCEKAAQLTEKGVDAYYHTNSASIVDDKKDAQACQLLQQFAAGTAKGITNLLANHKTAKTALLDTTKPVNIVGDITKGNGGAAVSDSIDLLTGRDVIDSIVGGTSKPISAMACEELEFILKNPAPYKFAKGQSWIDAVNAEYAKRCNQRMQTISGGIGAAGSSR